MKTTGFIALALAAAAVAMGASTQITPPAWTANLGMRDLENEIEDRVGDAEAAHKLEPAQADALKSQVEMLKVGEQAHRAARDLSEAEFNRVMGELLKISAHVPSLPLLHPPEAAPANASWVLPGKTSALDLTGYHLSFDDEFDTLDIAPDGGKARWYAPVHADFGEAKFQPPGAGGPFHIVHRGLLGATGGALAITASKAPDGWRSGLIQTLDGRGRGFAQQYGYFEMRARLPRGQATWPAFWLLTQNGLTDSTVTRGEIDVLEQYGSAPEKIHSSVHLWPASARNAGGLSSHWYKSEKIPVGDMAAGFHRYGVILTPDWLITYFDGMELSRFPMQPQYRTPVYMLVNLTMHAKNLDHATSPSVMMVDYVRAYAKG